MLWKILNWDFKLQRDIYCILLCWLKHKYYGVVIFLHSWNTELLKESIGISHMVHCHCQAKFTSNIKKSNFSENVQRLRCHPEPSKWMYTNLYALCQSGVKWLCEINAISSSPICVHMPNLSFSYYMHMYKIKQYSSIPCPPPLHVHTQRICLRYHNDTSQMLFHWLE